MSVRTVATIFASLSFLAIGGAVGALILLAGRRTAGAVIDSLRPMLIPAAAIVALTSTLGSLYLSEIALLEPCLLCWYQRIAMYPLPVILGIAAFRRDLAVRVYAIPIAVIGFGIAVYHYLIQAFPSLDTGTCALDIPCGARYLELFGFVSIPFMAAAGFLFVIAALALAGARSYDSEQS